LPCSTNDTGLSPTTTKKNTSTVSPAPSPSPHPPQNKHRSASQANRLGALFFVVLCGSCLVLACMWGLVSTGRDGTEGRCQQRIMRGGGAGCELWAGGGGGERGGGGVEKYARVMAVAGLRRRLVCVVHGRFCCFCSSLIAGLHWQCVVWLYVIFWISDSLLDCM